MEQDNRLAIYPLSGRTSDLKMTGCPRRLTDEEVIGQKLHMYADGSNDEYPIGHIVEVVDGMWYGILDIDIDEYYSLRSKMIKGGLI